MIFIYFVVSSNGSAIFNLQYLQTRTTQTPHRYLDMTVLSSTGTDCRSKWIKSLLSKEQDKTLKSYNSVVITLEIRNSVSGHLVSSPQHIRCLSSLLFRKLLKKYNLTPAIFHAPLSDFLRAPFFLFILNQKWLKIGFFIDRQVAFYSTIFIPCYNLRVLVTLYFVLNFLCFRWFLGSPYKGRYRYLNGIHFSFILFYFYLSYIFILSIHSISTPIFPVYLIFYFIYFLWYSLLVPCEPYKGCFFLPCISAFPRY